MMGVQYSVFVTSIPGEGGDSDAGDSESAFRNTDTVPTSSLETEAQRGTVTTAWSHSKFVAGLGNWNPKFLRPPVS